MAMIPLQAMELAPVAEVSPRYRAGRHGGADAEEYQQADSLAQEALQQPALPLMPAMPPIPSGSPLSGDQLLSAAGQPEQLQAFTHFPASLLLRDQGMSGALLRVQGAVLPLPDAAAQRAGDPRSGLGGWPAAIAPASVVTTATGQAEPELDAAALRSQTTAFAKVAANPLLATNAVTHAASDAAGDAAGKEGVRDKVAASLQALLAGSSHSHQGGMVEPAAPREGQGVAMAPMASQPARPGELQWASPRLSDQQAEWGQQLVDVLKDKVAFQANQQVKQAHIRLDPPELGRLELTVRMEGDKLNVQLNVTNPAVREALIQSMERLRMSLAPHHAGGVEVNVGQGGSQDQQRQGRGQQDEILVGRRQWQEPVEATGLHGRDWLNTLV